MKRFSHFFLALFVILAACEAEDLSPEEQAKKDEEAILEYIQKNNLQDVAEKHESGLYYVIEKPGSISRPSVNSVVTVQYKGMLLNGDVFDTTYDDGIAATFPLGGTIQGWRIGIPLFKKGGKGMLLIPSALGYGRRQQPGIPSNSVLIFDDIELVDFEN